MTHDTLFRIQETAAALAKVFRAAPKIGVVLGSGLGSWADRLDNPKSVAYSTLPSMPVSTVAGHAGRYVCGRLGGADVAVMQGRIHFYEGYAASEVVFPIRVLAALGVTTLILTNAAGGVNPDYRAGDLMLIRDQISLVPSPLIGENLAELGARFPDMSNIYDNGLANEILGTPEGAHLHQGVYAQVSGPQYETPAEIRAYRLLGADAIGMSTAIEAIAARHAGLRVAGISCITNPAAGLGGNLCHEEVQIAADRAKPRFSALLDAAVRIAAKD